MNFVKECAHREIEIIEKSVNAPVSIEGSLATDEYILNHSDIDLRVYTDSPSELANKFRNKHKVSFNILYCNSLQDYIYVFSYQKKYSSDFVLKYELSFVSERVHRLFLENEQNRIDNIDKSNWVKSKTRWYECIYKEKDFDKKKKLSLEFLIWKKKQIALYKIHKFSYVKVDE